MLINDEIFSQRVVASHVGSSTMPQKVNPIEFENARGNTSVVKGMLSETITHLMSKITYQRDMSDSTILRSVGSMFGYILLVIQNINSGTNKLFPNIMIIDEQLNNCPEIIMEGIQTYLKTLGVENAYEKAKQFSRGKKITMEHIHQFIQSFENISEMDRNKLLLLDPRTYLGKHPEFVF